LSRLQGNLREARSGRKAFAVREHVAWFDVPRSAISRSHGPDAGISCQPTSYLSTWRLSNRSASASRYLRDDGVIFDDGVVTCHRPRTMSSSQPHVRQRGKCAAMVGKLASNGGRPSSGGLAVTANWLPSTKSRGPRRANLASGNPISHFECRIPHMKFLEGLFCWVCDTIRPISYTVNCSMRSQCHPRYSAHWCKCFGKPTASSACLGWAGCAASREAPSFGLRYKRRYDAADIRHCFAGCRSPMTSVAAF